MVSNVAIIAVVPLVIVVVVVAVFCASCCSCSGEDDDDDVVVCVTATGLLEMTLEGHKGPIYDLDWHRDGLLLSASGDCTVRIWSPGTVFTNILMQVSKKIRNFHKLSYYFL